MAKVTKEMIEKLKSMRPKEADDDDEDLDQATTEDLVEGGDIPVPDDDEDLPSIDADAAEDPVVREMRTDPKTRDDYAAQHHSSGDVGFANTYDRDQAARARIMKEAPRLREQAKKKAFDYFAPKSKQKKGK